MAWGISTVVLSSYELFEATRPVYYKCLPLLGVQRHIELPWRTLPESYQGIGMPDFALLSLSSKLQLIQCICGFNDAASHSMQMGYESFLMEIGLYGNTLAYDYEKFACLATDKTWFKNVWELLQEFEVEASFGLDLQIHPMRAGDASLMELFLNYYSGSDLASLNLFRQHKKVIHISCIVLCDGRTIDQECLSMTRGHSDKYIFPLQYPTQADQSLWKAALQLISTTFYKFQSSLGEYTANPHRNYQWSTDQYGMILHRTIDKNSYELYDPKSIRST
jgi:hypothetical protein